MIEKTLSLKKDQTSTRWNSSTVRLAQKAEYQAHLLQLSTVDSERERLYDFHQKFTQKVNDNAGIDLLSKKADSLIYIPNMYAAQDYCKSFPEFLDRDDANIYLFYILEKYEKMYDLSFLEHAKVVKIVIPENMTATSENIETLMSTVLKNCA